MKKLIIALSTCAASFVAPQAFAQSAHFQGLGAALGLNVADTRTEIVGVPVPASDTDNDTNAILQLQYNAALNENVVLGVGASVNMGDLKAGSYSTTQLKEKDTWSFYVAPGYAFNNNWLGYLKLAYVNAKVKNSAGDSVNFDDGYGYGLGLQMLFNKHWFGQVEYMHDQFSDRTPPGGGTLKLRAEVVSLSAGYKF